MVFFNAVVLLSSVSDCTPFDRARFLGGGESWMGEDERLEDRLAVLATGFVGLAGAGLAVPLVVDGRGAALAGTVPAGPTEEALVDRRRGGWLDMTVIERDVFKQTEWYASCAS